MPLIYLGGAWVAGIFLGAEFNLPFVTILIGLIPLPLLFFVRQHRKTIVLASFSLIILFVAAAYSHSSLHTVDESSLRFYNGEIVEIRGMVARDPEVRDKSTHLRLSAAEIKLDKSWQPVKGTALLFVPRYPIYKYGDVLRLTGKLAAPARIDDFDYKDCVVTIASSATGRTPVISMFWPSNQTLILSMSSA